MIIEIALGIVLAVVILAFLPDLLGLGLILVLVALAIALVAFSYSWLNVHPSAIFWGLALLLMYVWLAPFAKRHWKSLNLEEQQQQVLKRRRMGYDTTILEVELEAGIGRLDYKDRLYAMRRLVRLGYAPKQSDA